MPADTAPARTTGRGAVAQLLRGVAMGSIELVPGVSSGTLALVLGIYAKLVHTIATGASAATSLLRGRVGEALTHLRAVPWLWLTALLAGIAAGVLVLAGPLETLLLDHPQAMAGLFFGLILGAAVSCWHMLKRPTPTVAAVLVVSAVLFFLLLSQYGGSDEVAEQVSRPLWVFFLGGAVAVCAMILPGISGSFILVLLGLYPEMIGALNARDLPVITVFLLGCVVGLASFAKLLDWLLSRHHDLVLGALIGLMLGALRVLWPWPHGLATAELGAPGDPLLAPVLLAALGFVVVVLVDRLGRRTVGS